MAKEKWKFVSDKNGEVHYYDSRKYNASTDPGGDVHFSKRSSGRKKAQKAMSGKNIAFYERTLFAVIVLVLLFRWFMMTEYGFTDEFFTQYPGAVDAWGNSIELYYFDFFKWLKVFAGQVADIKNVTMDAFTSLGSAFSDNDILSNAVNCVIFAVINLPLTLIKVIVLIPLTLIGMILGGFVYPWTLPHGWLYETIRFSVPYAQGLGDAITEWANNFDWGTVNPGPI